MCRLFQLRILAGLCVSSLLVNVCLAQSPGIPEDDSASRWQVSQLAELETKLADPTLAKSDRKEIVARKQWLSQWNVAGLPSLPRKNSKLPQRRAEPILVSKVSAEIRERLSWDQPDSDETDLEILKQALAQHPDDLALQQLHLHWLDLPIRRKLNLNGVEIAARRLLDSIRGMELLNRKKNRLVKEFVMYRRARALAYRELPEVVRHSPIDDPEELNREILAAYQALMDFSGSGRSEFILLEIRILRRAGDFGQALALVEKYGSVIPQKWYLKKRRDLLKELEWERPQAQAAKIYAAKFPLEVAKEKLASDPSG